MARPRLRPARAAGPAPEPDRGHRGQPGQPGPVGPDGIPGPRGLYVLFAFVIPIIYNLILSFEQTSPATIAQPVRPVRRASNYKFTLEQATRQSAIVRTFSFTILSLLFQFLIGFGLALMFNLKFPLRKFARSLIIIPWLLPLLITGFIFQFLLQAEAGAVNQVLGDIGLISHPIGFLTSPGWAYVAILIANIWIGIPFFTVLLYSALQDVPIELQGSGHAGRREQLAAAVPGHAADHPADHRGRVRARVRIHDQGLRRGDRADPGRPGQLHPAAGHLGLQPVVPAVRVRPGRGPQHDPADHRAGRGAHLHPAQPRLPAEGMT